MIIPDFQTMTFKNIHDVTCLGQTQPVVTLNGFSALYPAGPITLDNTIVDNIGPEAVEAEFSNIVTGPGPVNFAQYISGEDVTVMPSATAPNNTPPITCNFPTFSADPAARMVALMSLRSLALAVPGLLLAACSTTTPGPNGSCNFDPVVTDSCNTTADGGAFAALGLKGYTCTGSARPDYAANYAGGVPQGRSVPTNRRRWPRRRHRRCSNCGTTINDTTGGPSPDGRRRGNGSADGGRREPRPPAPCPAPARPTGPARHAAAAA